MKIRQGASVFMATFLMCAALGGCAAGGKKTNTVTVSFSEKDATSVQNLKKFDYFTSDWAWSGYTPASFDNEMLTVLPALAELNSSNMRIALGIGKGYNGIGANTGANGGDGSSDGEYIPALTLMEGLKGVKVQPYISISYIPEYAAPSGTWKSVPDDFGKYETFSRNVVTTMERNGVHAIYEILNEPDHVFFSGDWVDYTDTYIAGAKGVRSADPDAQVAGMSAARRHKAYPRSERGGEEHHRPRLLHRAYL